MIFLILLRKKDIKVRFNDSKRRKLKIIFWNNIMMMKKLYIDSYVKENLLKLFKRPYNGVVEVK